MDCILACNYLLSTSGELDLDREGDLELCPASRST